jgi:TPR repeat protein
MESNDAAATKGKAKVDRDTALEVPVDAEALKAAGTCTKREAPQNPSSSDTAPVAGDACKRVRTETDDTTTTEDVSVAIDAAAAAAAAVAEFKERTKMAMDRFVEEHKCPLTTELLCDPVTAEDGHNYEREMVEKLIKDSTSSRRNKKQKKLLRSPRTNEPMGAEIKSDVSLRNTIQNFVESGLIGGEVAESWTQRKLIIDTKKLAEEDGDPDAMQRLGEWYDGGLHGLPRSDVLARKWTTKADSARVSHAVRRVREDKDPDAMNSLGMWYSEGEKGLIANEVQAFKYFKMLADRNDARGMAQAGIRLADGVGTKGDVNAGLGLALRAADGDSQSDLACYCLGVWYHDGMYGLRSDETKAEHYLKKAVDGSCTFLHLGLVWEEEAHERLRRIKENRESNQGK